MLPRLDGTLISRHHHHYHRWPISDPPAHPPLYKPHERAPVGRQLRLDTVQLAGQLAWAQRSRDLNRNPGSAGGVQPCKGFQPVPRLSPSPLLPPFQGAVVSSQRRCFLLLFPRPCTLPTPNAKPSMPYRRTFYGGEPLSSARAVCRRHGFSLSYASLDQRKFFSTLLLTFRAHQFGGP